MVSPIDSDSEVLIVDERLIWEQQERGLMVSSALKSYSCHQPQDGSRRLGAAPLVPIKTGPEVLS